MPNIKQKKSQRVLRCPWMSLPSFLRSGSKELLRALGSIWCHPYPQQPPLLWIKWKWCLPEQDCACLSKDAEWCCSPPLFIFSCRYVFLHMLFLSLVEFEKGTGFCIPVFPRLLSPLCGRAGGRTMGRRSGNPAEKFVSVWLWVLRSFRNNL